MLRKPAKVKAVFKLMEETRIKILFKVLRLVFTKVRNRMLYAKNLKIKIKISKLRKDEEEIKLISYYKRQDKTEVKVMSYWSILITLLKIMEIYK